MNSKIYDKGSQQRAKQNMNLIHGEQPIKFMALNYDDDDGGGDESEFGGFSRWRIQVNESLCCARRIGRIVRAAIFLVAAIRYLIRWACLSERTKTLRFMVTSLLCVRAWWTLRNFEQKRCAHKMDCGADTECLRRCSWSEIHTVSRSHRSQKLLVFMAPQYS